MSGVMKIIDFLFSGDCAYFRKEVKLICISPSWPELAL
jgi:hypothetical protein